MRYRRLYKTEGRSPGERPSALQSLTAYLFLLAAFFAPFFAPFFAAFFFVAIVKNLVDLKCKLYLQRCIIFSSHNYSHDNVNKESCFALLMIYIAHNCVDERFDA
jgi:hypothetical protein